MRSALMSSLSRAVLTTARRGAPWLALGLPAAVAAQLVTDVHPRYAVAGKETVFTVEGSGLGGKSRNGAQVELATPPTPCVPAATLLHAEPNRLRFACTLAAEQASVELVIALRQKKLADLVLWKGMVQMLPAPPAAQYVAVTGADITGETTIACRADTPCLIAHGRLLAGKPFQLELLGSNLPTSTHAVGGTCTPDVSTDQGSPERKLFLCAPPKAGAFALKILTARPREGGTVLFNSVLTVGYADAGS